MNSCQAIERVACKRYDRLCLIMPESEASEHVASYLSGMAGKYKDSPHNLHFIKSLKLAYEVTK